MTTQSNACTCETCTGAPCTCGCQHPDAPTTSSPDCGEACTCGPTCACGDTCRCRGCQDAAQRLVESR